MRQGLQEAEQSQLALSDIGQHVEPAKAAAQQDQRGRDQRRQRVPGNEPRDSMHDGHQGQAEDHVLQQEGVLHRRSKGDEHRGQEVRHVRVREARSGEGRVLGREVLAVCEGSCDLHVEGQVTQVVDVTRRDRAALDDHHPLERQPDECADCERIHERPRRSETGSQDGCLE
jgi:hypothetical protein